MVKVCQELFPKLEGDTRHSDGFYMDDFLYQNLLPLSKKILEDWHFVIVITGSGWVRVGKSVLGDQVAAVLTHETNKHWKTNNTYTANNLAFKIDDLINKSFKQNKGSVIKLDEGDDLTEHYASRISYVMRRYFRKCGQLNQFLILIIPDFFDLPKSLAMSRSICLLDVYPSGELDRGFFRFFDFNKKKQLYLLGKKMHDYKAVEPNFTGRFTNFYTIDEASYRDMKAKDLKDDDQDNRRRGRNSKYVTWEWNIKRDEWFIKKGLSLKDFIESQGGNYEAYQKAKSVFKSGSEELLDANGY